MCCMSSLRSWHWNGVAPALFQTQAGLLQRAFQGSFYCGGLPPKISVTGKVKQSKSTNRCHTGNNRVLVVVMDMTTVHPIIKFLQWEGETGISAMRSLAMRWQGAGGGDVQFGNSNWLSPSSQSMSVMSPGCFVVFWWMCISFMILGYLSAALLWLIFLNSLSQILKYGYHR